MANLSTTTDPVAAVKNSDIVIEVINHSLYHSYHQAIVENIKIKQDLFKKLGSTLCLDLNLSRFSDDAAPPATIFASNTSSLNITDIASVTNRKDR